MEIHNCLLSTRIESCIFDSGTKEKCPDDDCSICLTDLKTTNNETCCGGYSKRM